MWFNYFKKIEFKYKYELSRKKPIIIRLDGKDTTKNTKYDFSQKNEFTDNFKRTAEKIVKKFDNCIAYIAIDEVSFIFKDPTEFFHYFTKNSDSLQYCLSMFQQYFINIFWENLPNTFFGVTIFNVPEDRVESYIKYRKTSAKNVAITYFAKRHLNKEEYTAKRLPYIIDKIKEKGLYETLMQNEEFVNGILIDDKYIKEKEDYYDSLLLDF